MQYQVTSEPLGVDVLLLFLLNVYLFPLTVNLPYVFVCLSVCPSACLCIPSFPSVFLPVVLVLLLAVLMLLQVLLLPLLVLLPESLVLLQPFVLLLLLLFL